MLDLRGGSAVHADGGDRDRYPRLRSVFHPTSDPLAIARGLRDRLGLRDLYAADLDAIAGAAPDRAFLRGAADLGLALWADLGLRDGADVVEGVPNLVAATETLDGPRALARLLDRVGPDCLVFGLDLQQGRPRLAPGALWETDAPSDLLERAAGLGVRRVLILDTAVVGKGVGPGGLDLVGPLLERHPGVEVTVGGGISGPADLDAIAARGVAAVLVGSALHDGRIGRADLEARKGAG